MRFDEPLYVSGTGIELAETTTLEAALEAGLCRRATVWRTGVRSVCVSAELSGPELAARAARRALGGAGAGPSDVDLVLHASTYHQGHDLWSAASYVQRESLGNACPSMEVRQLSNGGLAAVELAAGYLTAAPARRHSALVTTGDRFAPPGFDRFATDPGTICGDAGTALVLSTVDGFARLVALVTVSDPGLEVMGRGEDPFSDAPLQARPTIDVGVHRPHLLRSIGMTEMLERMVAGQQESFRTALDDAKIDADDVRRFVLPNLGAPKVAAQFLEPLGIDPARTTQDWGLGLGHLGAGDQIAGLAHLREEGLLASGDHCVLVGAGGGFTWTTAVLEML
ncbi:ketoacyl-ACP synthase III family protein [Pseudonocardia endophytica]|uniref:3-oxoacyl-[acyl-carrier-protein] synthase-3 n=1 Tax=Pseudonocardia endophytica TaxID=401976 RepID=A0A4R1HM70_PSEEN|nr:ketoacyl-ACP synthase III family protein [Pseudonocardia endophytica]TCK22211.1 3-oxoacyl-[acyl-carrier-protein] synthase-3 [Pseudonocardia endophytica]